jgi:NTE family protein
VRRWTLVICLALAVLPSLAPTQQRLLATGADAGMRCEGPTALVLGGGGVTGYAWEIGVLKGLEDAGVTLRQADLIVGTSAGALLAAQLAAGQSLDDLYAEIRRPRRGAQGSASDIDIAYLLETTRLWQDANPSNELRVEVGRRALEATSVVSEDDQIAFVVRALGVTTWPDRPLLISTTDTEDGTARLIDSSEAVSIERALAASIALPCSMLRSRLATTATWTAG